MICPAACTHQAALNCDALSCAACHLTICSPSPAGGVRVHALRMMRTYDVKPSQDRLTRSGSAAHHTDHSCKQAFIPLHSHRPLHEQPRKHTHRGRHPQPPPWDRTYISSACTCPRSRCPLNTRCSCARLACCRLPCLHRAFVMRRRWLVAENRVAAMPAPGSRSTAVNDKWEKR